MKRFLLGSALVAFYLSDGFVASGREPSNLDVLLEQESIGVAVDRRLPTASQPPDELSAWHAGLVKIDDEWRRLEQLSAATADNADYLKVRQERINDPQRHLTLARWCSKNQQPDLARAHYFGVLTSNTNNIEARKFLGHVLVGDAWIAKSELNQAQLGFQKQLEQLDRWVPKLKPIVQGLQSSNAKITAKALGDLSDIDVVESLPALEFYAANIDDDLAKPLVQKIAAHHSQESCLALVRIALAQPSSEIRQLAATAIREYPESLYVPELLGMLSAEVQVSNQLVVQPDGNIGLETLIKSELQNKNQVQRLRKLVNVISVFSSQHRLTLNENGFSSDVSVWSVRLGIPKSDPVKIGPQSIAARPSEVGQASARAVYVPQDVVLATSENLAEQGEHQQRLAAQQNRNTKVVVNNVCTLLRATTGEGIEDDPKMWWDWWNDRNERYSGSKPTSFAYNDQRQKIEISTRAYSNTQGNTYQDRGPVLIQFSCLVPGSLIQTARGLQPIEQIQIGDLVLSQNVETAELSLKPVILTTIRPPKSTIKILSTGTPIEATGGHNWWVSGQGWIKTRDLEPGMMLHTATGTIEVQGLEENAHEQRTYNLVVDGFHTYFVGPERVLSYDNTLVKPSLRRVPGFGLISDAR